jgi:SAM-dependent methyltransferase
MARTSYSSSTTGLLNRATELAALLRKARRPPKDTVDFVLSFYRSTQRRVLDAYGVKLEGLKMLDVGPGQYLGCLRCFSVNNDVQAIDTDVIAQSMNPVELARMLWHNNGLRTAKTLARQMLGVDARFERELARSLGVSGFKRLPISVMNATAMTFDSDTFDFVYSHSVFEHVDRPEAALREIVRVLKPGGVAYISVHHYTSHSGQHDPQILAGPGLFEPYWPHLRPAFQDAVHPNAYLNQLSLLQWRELFAKAMPGVRFNDDRHDAELGEPLKALRAKGELAGYSDDELLTLNVVALWKKPTGAGGAV